MAIIYKFPRKMKTLREQINEGFINKEIRDHLLVALGDLSQNYPNSWDKKFSEDLISYKNKLSDKQITNLERILQNPILEEEYPDGIEL